MKKYAEIVDNIVSNIAEFPDDHVIPDGWLDVTDIQCNIGWPVIDGLPEGPPGNWHTVMSDGSGWEITPENQALKDARESDKARSGDIMTAQATSGMKNDTVEGAQDKITQIFENIRSKPTDVEKLDTLINRCEVIFKKIAVELLR